MNINFQHLIPWHFNDASHVWVYQSNRPFTTQETLYLERILQNFIKSWKIPGYDVKVYANLFFGQFIILMADETNAEDPSFSTHAFLRLIKNIGKDFDVELFDRMMLAFIIQKRIQLLPLSQLNLSIEKDLITPDTLYFNNTILTKKELLNSWIIPVKESWLSNRMVEQNENKTE